MSETFLVRGFWGPRAEANVDLAQRTCAFLSRLGRLRPEGFGDWVLADDSVLSVDDPASLGARIEQKVELRGAEGAELGVVLVVSGSSPTGATCRVTATVGVTSQLEALQNSIVVKLQPSMTGDSGEWLAAAEQTLSDLVDEWAPDWGDVSTRGLSAGLRGKVTVENRAPRIGFFTYVSGSRWSLLNGVQLTGNLKEHPLGGGMISLPSEDVMSPVDAAIATDAAVRDSGALAPMPTDRPHL